VYGELKLENGPPSGSSLQKNLFSYLVVGVSLLEIDYDQPASSSWIYLKKIVNKIRRKKE